MILKWTSMDFKHGPKFKTWNWPLTLTSRLLISHCKIPAHYLAWFRSNTDFKYIGQKTPIKGDQKQNRKQLFCKHIISLTVVSLNKNKKQNSIQIKNMTLTFDLTSIFSKWNKDFISKDFRSLWLMMYELIQHITYFQFSKGNSP